jgi:putative membrane protein
MLGYHILLDEARWHWWFAPFWILFWSVLIVAFWRFAPLGRRRGRRFDARAILAERFARGEIDAAEYTARLEVLDQ